MCDVLGGSRKHSGNEVQTMGVHEIKNKRNQKFKGGEWGAEPESKASKRKGFLRTYWLKVSKVHLPAA